MEASTTRGAASPERRRLDGFTLLPEVGGERAAIERVRAAVAPLGLPPRRLEALGTAIGEATMNAMEHGSGYAADKPVDVVVTASADDVSVAITDLGTGHADVDVEAPDIDAKIRGEQSPRGWGLFLVRSLVDHIDETTDGGRHTVTLTMRLDAEETPT